MMGVHQSQKKLFAFSIDLDRRVRGDHPLRRVSQTIDFEFIRKEVEQFYGNNGNVSVDPVVILKLMFLLFWDDVKSERTLMRTLPERLDYLWFLGFDLDDEVPNHSVLSKARQRWGEGVFEELFIRVVSQCVDQGLVEGSKIHVDSSLIDANASKDSVATGTPEVIARYREVTQAVAAKLDDTTVTPGRVATNDTHVSTTDPDATLVRRAGSSSRPRYHHHRAVDDKHGVITAVETTTGSIAEDHKLGDLVDQHEANTEEKVDTVVADSKYGTISNYISCEKKAIRSHFKSQADKGAHCGRREGIFGEDRFKFDPNSNTYTCPTGEFMNLRRLHSRRQTYEYVTSRVV